jgi:hypothetical protein
VLYVGAENWPFPIPLEARKGVWQFDADGGAKEIRFRRIGENEVMAIGICHALVAPETRAPSSNGDAARLVQRELPYVQDADRPLPFHGYYFRIMSKSGGGFAVIAHARGVPVLGRDGLSSSTRMTLCMKRIWGRIRQG